MTRKDSKFPKIIYGVSVYNPKIKTFIDHSSSNKHPCWISCKDTDKEEAVNELGWSAGYWRQGPQVYFASNNKDEVKRVAKNIRQVLKEMDDYLDEFGKGSSGDMRVIYNAVRASRFLKEIGD